MASNEAGSSRFSSGDIYATPGAIDSLTTDDMAKALGRHFTADWGELCKEDIAANNQALQHGGRVLSSYRNEAGTKFWIITEADRSATTILLPHEY